MNERIACVNLLTDLLQKKKSLRVLLPYYQQRLATEQQQAWLQAVSFGVCRHYFRLEFFLETLLTKSLPAKQLKLKVLLLVGLYQLIYLRTPDHAAVNETVNCANQLKFKWAKKLINAILRNYLRQAQHLTALLDSQEQVISDHPAWLFALLKANYPENYKTLIAANNQQPPLVLRVNQQKITLDDYLALLAKENIAAEKSHLSPVAIILKQAQDVTKLPFFTQGFVSVQDAVAQLAALILAPKAGASVLDACAAPGGKTTHLLEYQPQLAQLVAIDQDESRLLKVTENLQRLALQAKVHCADVSDLSSWWDGQRFDNILLDAPCSATGVIRRHPDIKLLRQASDIAHLAKLQQHLLTTLWPVLKPGGSLLYATCSVLPMENQQVISDFLKTQSDAQLTPFSCYGEHYPGEKQFLATPMHDGFYYAKLTKKTV